MPSLAASKQAAISGPVPDSSPRQLLSEMFPMKTFLFDVRRTL
jgi:hypothetical protein